MSSEAHHAVIRSIVNTEIFMNCFALKGPCLPWSSLQSDPPLSLHLWSWLQHSASPSSSVLPTTIGKKTLQYCYSISPDCIWIACCFAMLDKSWWVIQGNDGKHNRAEQKTFHATSPMTNPTIATCRYGQVENPPQRKTTHIPPSVIVDPLYETS